MSEETAFVRKARQHKGKIASGVGGAGIMGLLAVAYPWFTDQKESDVNQWKEISVLKQRLVAVEIKLDFYLQKESK